MFKDNIDIEELRAKTICILDELEGIENYGYVGNYAMSKEETSKINSDVDDYLNETITLLQKINEKIVESFEY